MKVIVTGGRNYCDAKRVDEALTIIRPSEIIHGGARGLDTLAGLWAQKHNIKVKVYPAYWDTFGLSAGPKRNQLMLSDNQDAMVLAFPGGRGTGHCVGLARKMGMRVTGVDYMKEGIYEL